MDVAGYKTLADFRGNAVPNVVDWQYLDLNYKTIASIDPGTCIQCGLCHIVCEDTEHQAIQKTKTGKGKRRYEVMTRNASAATCATWSARCRGASRWWSRSGGCRT